jgi:hypothetical protein
MVPVFIKTVTLNNKGLSDRARFSELTSCLYEKIDPNIYDLDARMVAFRVTSSRLLHWIHALDILFYEFQGDSEDYDIKWEDDPIERKNPSDLKTITIDVSSENLARSDNPLLFRVTVFMKTGTIQAQGNKHDIFRTRDFPMLESSSLLRVYDSDCVFISSHFVVKRVSPAFS